MPNWCNNTLQVYGPAREVARFKKQAVGFDPWMTAKQRVSTKPCQLNFYSLVPIPKKVLKAPCDETTYNWKIENWGCKWGASLGGDPADVQCMFAEGTTNILWDPFDTPWNPPLAFIENVSKKWPTLLFLLDYNEPGNAFKGIAQAKAGKIENYQITYGEINQTKEAAYSSMLAALKFALPYMEDLANSSHNANEERAAQLMGDAIATAEQKPPEPTTRSEQEFAISGFYITRDHLETLGFDTANVDDAKMEQVASRLGALMDWKEEDAIAAAERFDIPKHPEKPKA